jgi:DHA1 family inner membrane transport protein
LPAPASALARLLTDEGVQLAPEPCRPRHRDPRKRRNLVDEILRARHVGHRRSGGQAQRLGRVVDIIQLFSESLGIDIPTATNAITAYAFGVVVGAPLVTLVAARLNRRTLLLCLMALFVAGNLLSAAPTHLGFLAAARFIAGMPQGAYFGCGAVVAAYIVGPGHGGKAFALVMAGLTIATILGSPPATFLGQNLGWRETYLAVAFLAALSFGALWLWVPRTDALRGSPVAQELRSLRRSSVWAMMLVAALGVAVSVRSEPGCGM